MKIKILIEEKKSVKVYLDRIENLVKILNQENLSNRSVILTHKKLWNLYCKKFKDIDKKLIFFPEGEVVKEIKYIEYVYTKLLKYKVDRTTPILILGGGVLGDLGGFVASTYMRGLPYVQIPTTLLAMVDSSIGGKTAVNLKQGKNLVGSFYQPKVVICDLYLLGTLPEKEIYSGYGEILKYAVINRKIFHILSSHEKEKFISTPFPINNLTKKLILECIKTKLEIVKKDEKETTGLREKLNLGHTIAHGIESVTGYKVYTHGEAVILGLVTELWISKMLNLISYSDGGKIFNLINYYIDKEKISSQITNIEPEKIYTKLQYDKKVRTGKIRFVLPTGIGKIKTVEKVPKNVVINSLKSMYLWIKEK